MSFPDIPPLPRLPPATESQIISNTLNLAQQPTTSRDFSDITAGN